MGRARGLGIALVVAGLAGLGAWWGTGATGEGEAGLGGANPDRAAEAPSEGPADGSDARPRDGSDLAGVRASDPMPDAGAGAGDDVPVADGGSGPTTLVLQVRRDGAAAPAGVVLLLRPAGEPWRELRTGEAGTVRVEGLPPGPALLVAPGGATRELVLVAGEARVEACPCAGAPGVRGTVRAATGAPVPGARVVRESYFGPQLGWRPRTEVPVDGDGRFELPANLDADVLSARAAGAGPSPRLLLQGPGDAWWDDVELVLAGAGASLGVTVADVDGAPVPGARVRVVPQGADPEPDAEPGEGRLWLGPGVGVGVTDGSGRVDLEALPAGPASVVVDATADTPSATRELELVGGAHLDLRVELARGVSLHGRVLDAAGAGVAGAEVEARDAAGRLLQGTTSGPDGGFRLPALVLPEPPDGDAAGPLAALRAERGRVRLQARREGLGVVERDLDLALDGARPVELVLVPAVLRARLLDAADRPLAGWRVTLEARRLASGARLRPRPTVLRSDADGRVDLGDLAGGRYRVQAYAPGEEAGPPRLSLEVDLPCRDGCTWRVP